MKLMGKGLVMVCCRFIILFFLCRRSRFLFRNCGRPEDLQDNEPNASPYCRLLKRQALTCSSRSRGRKHPVIGNMTADCRPSCLTHNAGGDRRDGEQRAQ